MADVQAAFRARLVAHAGTQAIISSRAWDDHLPQNPTLPAVSVQQVSGPRTHAMGSDTGDVNGRVQVDSWAASRSAAKSLAEQVRAALQRVTGTFSGTTISGTYMDNEEGPRYESTVKLWRTRQDYMTWWRE